MTAHAARLLAGKFAKYGDANAAVDEMISNGWQGFKPSWMEDSHKPGAGNGKMTGVQAVLAAAAEIDAELDEAIAAEAEPPLALENHHVDKH